MTVTTSFLFKTFISISWMVRFRLGLHLSLKCFSHMHWLVGHSVAWFISIWTQECDGRGGYVLHLLVCGIFFSLGVFVWYVGGWVHVCLCVFVWYVCCCGGGGYFIDICVRPGSRLPADWAASTGSPDQWPRVEGHVPLWQQGSWHLPSAHCTVVGQFVFDHINRVDTAVKNASSC